MQVLHRYVAPPSPCGYLPQQRWSLEYEYVRELSKEEYLQRMLEGWRRFGHVMFHPVCPHCQACQAVRVRVGAFRPNRSQRRVRKLNEGVVDLRIGSPSVTRARLDLYDRFHEHQAEVKGWPEHAPRDAESYARSFVLHPFPVEEWTYYLDGSLVGVGYVDVLPSAGPGEPAGGLSAIYYFHDPDQRHRSLGTWNVLCILEEARSRGLPWVYLGYFVEGCSSLAYKRCFRPNQLRGPDGVWRDASA